HTRSKRAWSSDVCSSDLGYVLADGDGAEYRLQAGESVETSITSDTVSNTKQGAPDLPLTGAQGTLLFTVVGIGLIGAGAAAVAEIGRASGRERGMWTAGA